MIKKWKNLNIKKVSFPLLLAAWLLILFWFQPWVNFKAYMIRGHTEPDSSSKVYASLTVRQSFIANGTFDSVDIHLSNYNGTYEGSCIVKIYDASDRCVFEKTVDKLELESGWLEIHLETAIQSDGDQFWIEISAPELTNNNCVVVHYSDRKTYTDDELLLYGKNSSRIMCFSVYDSKRNVIAYAGIFIFIASAAAWWIWRKSVMRSSLIVLAGMGLCMLVIMAPMSAPDESYHYDSSFVLSNIILGKSDIYGFEEEYSNKEGIWGHYNANTAYIRAMHDIFNGEKNLGNVVNRVTRINELRHPVIYLAPALGITLGRLMGFNFMQVYYMGRLFNLLLYISLALAAVWIIPKYKDLLLLVAALPMCLHQAASFSYDIVINGMSFLFTAYVLKMSDQEKCVSWKDLLILVVMGGIMCPNKIVYIVLPLLTLIIPKERFRNSKDRILKSAFVICGVLLIVLFVQHAVFRNLMSVGQTASVAGDYSIRFAVEHPVKYLNLLYRTVSVNLISWIKLGLGNGLAGLTLWVYEYLVFGFLFLLLLSAFRVDGKELVFGRLQKTVLWLTVIAGTGLVVCALSTAETYGASIVAGVQGRYFIPYMVPVLLGIRTSKIKVNIKSETLIGIYWFLQAGIVNCILSSVVF